jgi:acetate kinase
MSGPILVLNCGSSSVKFALFDADIQPLPRKPTWRGIGENSAVLRERVSAALGWLELDAGANAANAATISSPRSRVRVAVEPTNEEWIAASHAVHVLAGDMSHAAA